MKHLRDPDVDWMGDAAPCLPNLSETEWSSILDCSYFNFELSSAESIPKEQAAAEGTTEEGDDDGGDGDDESDIDEAEQNDGDDPEPVEPEPEEISPEDRVMGSGSNAVEAWDAPAAMDSDGHVADDSNNSMPMDPASKASGPTEDSKDQQTQADGEQAPETQAAREERYKDVKPEPVPEITMKLIDQLLTEIKETNPQYNLNGTANIWILKPGGKSRGRGIRCVNKLRDVQRLADNNLHNNTVRARTGKKKTMWVVQKYMENPLTIRRRKFDIRQWVLVTDWNPLTVWFYDACYLRFAAEEYSVADFQNRFSHLTNNTIQIKSSEFEESKIEKSLPASFLFPLLTVSSFLHVCALALLLHWLCCCLRCMTPCSQTTSAKETCGTMRGLHNGWGTSMDSPMRSKRRSSRPCGSASRPACPPCKTRSSLARGRMSCLGTTSSLTKTWGPGSSRSIAPRALHTPRQSPGAS